MVYIFIDTGRERPSSGSSLVTMLMLSIGSGCFRLGNAWSKALYVEIALSHLHKLPLVERGLIQHQRNLGFLPSWSRRYAGPRIVRMMPLFLSRNLCVGTTISGKPRFRWDEWYQTSPKQRNRRGESQDFYFMSCIPIKVAGEPIPSYFQNAIFIIEK